MYQERPRSDLGDFESMRFVDSECRCIRAKDVKAHSLRSSPSGFLDGFGNQPTINPLALSLRFDGDAADSQLGEICAPFSYPPQFHVTHGRPAAVGDDHVFDGVRCEKVD
jgi:hypothetical protein